jgi:hypothetical protein
MGVDLARAQETENASRTREASRHDGCACKRPFGPGAPAASE